MTIQKYINQLIKDVFQTLEFLKANLHLTFICKSEEGGQTQLGNEDAEILLWSVQDFRNWSRLGEL